MPPAAHQHGLCPAGQRALLTIRRLQVDGESAQEGLARLLPLLILGSQQPAPAARYTELAHGRPATNRQVCGSACMQQPT